MKPIAARENIVSLARAGSFGRADDFDWFQRTLLVGLRRCVAGNSLRWGENARQPNGGAVRTARLWALPCVFAPHLVADE
jgi:hypothetical protein